MLPWVEKGKHFPFHKTLSKAKINWAFNFYITMIDKLINLLASYIIMNI